MKQKVNLFLIIFLAAIICMGITTKTVFATPAPATDFRFDSSTGTITKYIGLATAVEIPSKIDGVNVTTIGDQAFSNCSELTSITIPSSVITIGSFAFFGCEGLTSMTIPSCVTTIGDCAFDYCSGLTCITVDINNIAYASEDGVLYNKARTQLIQYPLGCTIKSFVIPNSVATIGIDAFASCSKLTSITIPNSVTTIGTDAFTSCDGLISITIPSSVTTIGPYAFAFSRGLTSITVDINNIAYASEDGVLYNKEKTQLIQYPIGSSGNSFIIPSSVTMIDSAAFSLCSGLTNITLPSSLTRIADQAFSLCSGLTSINIPSSVTIIEDHAFYLCENLSSAHFYGNAPTLGSAVFLDAKSNFIVYYQAEKIGFTNPWNGYRTAIFGNTETENSTISPSTVSFDKGLTDQTDIITTITLNGNSLSSIANGEATLMLGTDYTISGSTITIKKGYLATQPVGITNLTFNFNSGDAQILVITISDAISSPATDFSFDASSGTITRYIGSAPIVNIPSQIGGVNVTRIGDYAFCDCMELTSVRIPNSVTSIGDYVFFEDSGLTNITVDPNNTAYISEGGVLYNKAKTMLIQYPLGYTSEDFIIPSSVTSIGHGAFSNCRNLKNINVDSSNIAYSSEGGVLFNKTKTQLILCPTIKSGTYIIPDGVTTIGESAFIYSRLSNITIPNSVTTIGDRAFIYCDISNITLPSCVATIGEHSFWNCGSLTSITIPSSVTLIGDCAFGACRSLNSIIVDENNIAYSSEDNVLYNKAKTQLIQYAVGCSNETFIIPNSVTTIKGSAFSDCEALTSISIPSSVRTIESYAFYYCRNLSSAYFYGNAPSLQDNVFSDVKSGFMVYYSTWATGFTNPWNGYATSTFINTEIENSTISPVMASFSKKIGAQADVITTMTLYGNTLSSIDNNGAALILGTDYTVSGNIVTIKKEYLANQPIGETILTFHFSAGNTQTLTIDVSNSASSPVTDFTFDASTGTITKYIGSSTNVEIPSKIGGVSVIAIGNYAFDNCTNIVSVTIPNSVTSIGNSAFGGCSGLTSVTIPNGVTSISEGSFSNCIGLTSVTIPNGVTSIGIAAFSNCVGLISITIPDSVTLIGKGSFFSCNGLTTVTIPYGVTSIGKDSFGACMLLNTITVDKNNKGYLSEDGVLFNKEKTQLIQFPGGKSGSYIIPSSVQSIGDFAFLGCSGLTTVTIPSGVTSIGEASFGACMLLNAITVDKNNSAYKSEDGVLFNKEKTQLLQYPSGKKGGYIIPGSVTKIMDLAFGNCFGLISVTIPRSVTSIGRVAFFRCKSLAFAYFEGDAPTLGANVFDDTKSGFVVYYRTGNTGFSNPWNGYPTAILKYGDVDGDGSVTQNDYDLVKQFILSKLSGFPSQIGILAADIDGDGRITSKDEALLLRIIRSNK